MKLGPDIARIAALLGDPARANMMTALLGGQALTAGELAREAGVTPQTASSHLAKLQAGGLVVARRQGRHGYFSLASDDVAGVLEKLMGLAVRTGHQRTRTGPKEPALRQARVCYDHLAGDMGVALLEAMVADGRIEDRDGALAVTGAGEAFARDFGIDLAALRGARRPMCKACLDWSVRRSHLAGGLGAALLARIYDLGWARRVEGARVVSFTPQGLASFAGAFPPIAFT
jgi:DNA-binding transcriptional ArsR family regulator